MVPATAVVRGDGSETTATGIFLHLFIDSVSVSFCFFNESGSDGVDFVVLMVVVEDLKF
ncbi:hypothetical protein A2U01_0032710 [Trifolium medium]|uniref:Uncharacterized protein n=1 Tax=Trifolium medium TaxID=97028 RepID=A0A392PHR7_9FABA|nr:hypothetical protein [Trifolium medium]